MSTYVAYVRVSTQRQGVSGLGLEAQRAAINAFITPDKIVAEYREIESGRKSRRPQLAAAISHAKASGARLVIAKLDRLARNVAFVSALMDSGVDFVAVDMPDANRLTVHVLAAVAEAEARAISERTIVALAAKRRRGGPEWRVAPSHASGAAGRAAAVEVKRAAFAETHGPLLALVTSMRAAGQSNKAIARHFTAKAFKTPGGSTTWQATQIARLVARTA